MDPQATLELIFDALAAGDTTELHYALAELFDWRRKGGFAPNMPYALPDGVVRIEVPVSKARRMVGFAIEPLAPDAPIDPKNVAARFALVRTGFDGRTDRVTL